MSTTAASEGLVGHADQDVLVGGSLTIVRWSTSIALGAWPSTRRLSLRIVTMSCSGP